MSQPQTISTGDIAKFHAPIFSTVAKILRSNEGQKFLNENDFKYGLDTSRVHENLIELLSRTLHSSSFPWKKKFESHDWDKIAGYFDGTARMLSDMYDLNLNGLNEVEINPQTIKKMGAALNSEEWYSKYPEMYQMRSLPLEYTKALSDIHNVGRLLFALCTLKYNTGNVAFERFLSCLKASYLESSSSVYIHDILISDVLLIQKKNDTIIRYNATYPSSIPVCQVNNDPMFVYVNYATGVITGESKVMFTRHYKTLSV